MVLPDPVVRPDAVEHYAALLSEAGMLPSEALCLTVVRGVSVDEALTRFDAPPSGRVARLVEVAGICTAAYPEPLPLVVADRIDGWTVLAEDNGYHGADPEVMARLSVGTVAASVFWNVNLDSLVTLAVGGRVLAALEFTGGATRGGDDPDAISVHRQGLAFRDPYRYRAEALAMLERFSGVRLPADWPTRQLPAAVIVDPKRFRPANPSSWLAVNAPDLPVSHALACRAAAWACRAHDLTPAGDGLAQAHADYRQALHLRWRRCLPTPAALDQLERLQARMRRRALDHDPDHDVEQALVGRAHAWAAHATSQEADPTAALGWTAYNACQADRAHWPDLLAALRSHPAC